MEDNKGIRSERVSLEIMESSIPYEYRIVLTADSGWLNDPNTTYPVIIDPTVTHNADANFTGQFNRIADSDATTSTQLEASYPEATKDPHTVLLLHFNEANGTTAGIKDYASSTRVITSNNNASTTNSVTQLGMGNSAGFNDTGDPFFSIPDSNDWNFGLIDFTIDFWVYSLGSASYDGIISANSRTTTGWLISFKPVSQKITLTKDYVNFSTFLVTTNNDVTANKWHHIAVVRNGTGSTGLAIYVDGIVDGTGDGNVIINSDNVGLFLGKLSSGPDTTEYLNGYLDEVRIIKGRALTPEEIKAAASRRPYAVYTSPVVDAAASVSWNTVNWTEGGVNTGDGETLYSSTNLVAQWNFNNTSGTTATNNAGSCGASCNGTLTNFDTTSGQDATTTSGWTANNKKWGAGALMFDGSNDYVSVGDNDGWNFGAGDFSIDFWLRFNALTNYQIFFGQQTDANNRVHFRYTDDSSTPRLQLQQLTGGSVDILHETNWTPSAGVWYHIALVKSSNTYITYVNGASIGSTADSSSNGNFTGNFYIGSHEIGGFNQVLNGTLDSLRIYKGRALSASEILSNYNAGNIEIQTRTGATSDPNDGSWEAWKPTTGETQLLSMDSDKSNWNAPEQIDSYTKLLLHMDGTDAATTFPDSALTPKTVTAVNQAQVDTAQSKFGGGSGLFDGTGDYLSVPDSADWALGGTFTIDAWVRFNTIVNNVWIVGQGNGVVGENYWTLYYGVTTLNFSVIQNSSTIISISNSWTPVANRWYHVAVVDNGGTWKLFVDGVQLGTDGSDIDTVHDISSSVFVGADVPSASHLNGWLDELRISKGIARWTSNFTPPPRAYGSNVKADNETTLKQEGTASTKFTIGAPQVDGNTVALWRFEETGTTTGTYLYDETANNNDATTTGTTVVDGIFGKARKFNSTSDYITSGTVATFKNFHGAADTTGFKWTIDFWTKINNFSATQYFINNTLNADTNAGFNLTINTSREIVLQIGRNGNNSYVYTGPVGSGTYPNDNGWHHVTVTYDQALVSGNAKAYVDGVYLGSANKSGQVPDTTNADSVLRIGQSVTGTSPLNGAMDEIRMIYGRALSADEIAETYRMGANHHLTRQVSAADLSGANKLAFNVAADRPGTYLEAMLGESDYANYELASSTLALSTTTVLYIKGDEIASSTSIKDSSFSGKAITAVGNARTAGGGKRGNSVYFDGTGDWIDMADSDDWTFGDGEWSIDFWFNTNVSSGGALYMAGQATSDGTESINNSLSNNKIHGSFRNSGGSAKSINGITAISTGVWYHYALIRTGNTLKLFLNGAPEGSVDTTGFTHFNQVAKFAVGRLGEYVTTPWNGYMDEFRILKGTALTPDQIRQAYEYGLRTHPITIDFGATLQTSDLISSATDYNFSLTATTSGLSATTSGLYLGDKIIIKENLGGTEYTAQGTVNAINTATGAITVPSWDTGSTFPSGNGYSPNATVFKWQREYFDITGSLSTHRDAITNLTLRPTNGAEGRTIYLDDFRYSTNYLTAPSSSTITSSNNRYLQYRAIFTSWDSFISPFLSAISVVYTSLATMFAPIISPSGGGFLSF